MTDFQCEHTGQCYEIMIKGYLDDSWADWFEGLAFAYGRDSTTILTGEILDQSALHGVLKKIRDLGMPLLSVNHLGPDLPNMTQANK